MDALRACLSDLVVKTRACSSYSSIISKLVLDNELILKRTLSVPDRSGIYQKLVNPSRIYSGKSPIASNVADSPWFDGYSAQYESFLLALYGKSINKNNQPHKKRHSGSSGSKTTYNNSWFNLKESSFTHVNHSELYSAYEALPYPQPIYISASTLNDFLKAFLSHRTFVSGDPVLNRRVKPLSLEYLQAYKRANIVRQRHLKQCNRILSDLRSCAVQIFPTELSQYLTYYFFQDKLHILDKVEKAAASEGFPSPVSNTAVTVERCQDFIDSVGASTMVYNSLLAIAVRSQNAEVLEMLQSRLYTGQFVANRKTVGLLLSQAKKVQEVTKLVSMLQDMPVDTRTIDEVVGAICRVAPELTEWFFYQFYEANGDAVERVSSTDGHLHLNALDEARYNSLMLLYDNLVEILGLSPKEAPQGYCAPSEHSFYTFLAGSLKADSRFFDLMWAHGVPLSSRMFKVLFSKADNINETISLMYALVYEAEKRETSGAHLEKLRDQKILPRLRQFLESSEEDTSVVPDLGAVKLSKDTIEIVYNQLMKYGSYEQRKACRSLRDELYTAEGEMHHNWSDQRRNVGYALPREAYILRKAFIIEAIDVVERGEGYID